jgi:hypothetical protein
MIQPVPKPKTCGACTLCCKVMGIVELAKPMGVWCGHCSPGKGCGVYDSRPASCRVFACQWLLDPALPRRFRPDQTKVVLVSEVSGPPLVAYCDPAHPYAWRREPIYGWLKAKALEMWKAGGIPLVLVRAGSRLWRVTPTDDTDVGEVALNVPLDITCSPEGKLVVNILPAPEAPEAQRAVWPPVGPR